MVKPKDILYVSGSAPLGGSALKKAEKENIVAGIIRACQKKNPDSWQRIYSNEVAHEWDDLACCFAEEALKEALTKLIGDKYVVTGIDQKGTYFEVTNKLLRLLIQSTYAGGYTYSNAEELLQTLNS